MTVLKSQHNSYKTNLLVDFTNGIEQDKRLAVFEIRVQKAWAKAMGEAGILSEKEVKKAMELLTRADELIAMGQFEWHIKDEDIHMNLERFLTENAGNLGKKIHLGRSRNDLIATTLRLFVKDIVQKIEKKLVGLSYSLVTLAEKNKDVIVPGLTHLQSGQAVRFSHIFLNYVWCFLRDLRYLKFVEDVCVEEMPLGSAAMTGTTLKQINLTDIAQELGFKSPPRNSYDMVSDRDFMLSASDAFSKIAVHLSRLSDDIIIWSSTGFGLVDLPKDWSTGSSIMPNKRNPDIAELTRAKTSHVISASNNLHMIVKSVPTSYGSDLHEMKQVFMNAYDQLKACLEIYPFFVEGLKINKENCLSLLNKGHILATEIANELTEKGNPFRESYKKVASLVQKAKLQEKQVHEIAEEEYSFESAVEKRTNDGGSSKKSIENQIKKAKEELGLYDFHLKVF